MASNPYVNKVDLANGTTLIDLTADTATQADVAQGKYFHLPTGQRVQGTASGGGTGGIYQDQDGYLVLSPDGGGGGSSIPWLGTGAEKIGTVINKTINLSTDTTYDSWTPSTTATEILSASASSEYTLSGDLDTYDYCFVTQGYIEPVYVTGTPETQRTYRVVQNHLQYFYGYPLSSNTSDIQQNTADYTGSYSSTTYMFVQYYYNNTGVMVSRSATQCGPCYMSSFPTLSYSGSSTNWQVGITFPAFMAKCDTSRFTTERAGQIDSANTNYLLTVDVYRIPRENGFVSHWIKDMCDKLNAT